MNKFQLWDALYWDIRELTPGNVTESDPRLLDIIKKAYDMGVEDGLQAWGCFSDD